MKLARLVRLTYPKLSESWNKWHFNVNEVEVGCMSRLDSDTNTEFLVCALATLEYKPKLTADNKIVIPAEHRRKLEVSIEHVANLISLDQEVKRKINSLNPSIAFNPENDDELFWLNKTNGVLLSREHKIPIRGSLNVDVYKILPKLNDRMDGIALLVEAICQSQASGKFREYIRVLERAFKLSAKKSIKALGLFLSQNNMGYTEQEIDEWIKVRDPLTHADFRDEFYLESDVFKYINRMEQACYDIVFNKLNWRSEDSARRNVWHPLSGSSGNNSNIFITKGYDLKLGFQILDEFGVFLKSTSSLNKLPKGFWFKENDRLKATE